jgi:hypothetical protein
MDGAGTDYGEAVKANEVYIGGELVGRLFDFVLAG